MSARSPAAPRAVASLLPKLTKAALARRGLADSAIVTDWALIVGSLLAAHSAPERIARPRDKAADATLDIRVDSGAWATELQHLEPLVVERVNSYCGYRAIGRIGLRQGPLPPRREIKEPPRPRSLSAAEQSALDTSVAGIADEKLRAALRSLGGAMLARRRPG